mgnify:CR=1 FL=1|tara:strand:+ start:170 stop:577 length:408 start_codon:yes stop_codon:yes gene_type:complete
MKDKLIGSCFCGEVTFEVVDSFKAFYQCHCHQCQKLTGTAFASNLITDPLNIEWIAGLEFISTYEHPQRSFSKAFCKSCGAAVPFINKSKTSLIVPAGSLDTSITMELEANIFVSEKACWSATESSTKHYSHYPE